VHIHNASGFFTRPLSNKATEAIEPEDLMPKAKTQSKNRFLKARTECGCDSKIAKGRQREKENRSDTMLMIGWE
jgi:hypothetical protein